MPQTGCATGLDAPQASGASLPLTVRLDIAGHVGPATGTVMLPRLTDSGIQDSPVLDDVVAAWRALRREASLSAANAAAAA